jgi:oligopeptide transport system ATP-binding protein
VRPMSDEAGVLHPVDGRPDAAAAFGNGRPPLLEVEHLVKHFPIKYGVLIDREIGRVHAVDDVTLTVEAGETLGLVGESGCGKTTLSRTALKLLDPTAGSIRFHGREIAGLSRGAMRPLRREMQMIFQDPYASLNPRKRVGQIIGEPLALHGVASGEELRRQVQGLLERVGLGPEHYNRYPHEFSGGQRQRIGVARALALRPELVIADEPVSALDVSIQAQIINLLEDLQDEFSLTYVFVAHDLGVIRHVSDRIAVMYLGKIVELAAAEELYRKPIHPYSVALLSAVPIPDPKENEAREPLILEGDVPSAAHPPPACRFHTRCPWASEICSRVEPPLVDYGNGHLAACHHPQNVSEAEIRAAVRSAASPATAGEQLPSPSEGVAEAPTAAVAGEPGWVAPGERAPAPPRAEAPQQAPPSAPAGPGSIWGAIHPAAKAGVVAALLGLLISLSSETRTFVNGEQASCTYFDLFPVLAGAFCIGAAALAGRAALRPASPQEASARGIHVVLAVLLVVLGVLNLLRGFGVLFSPC